MKIKSITPTNKLSTITVSDEIFGSKTNDQLLSQAIRVYLSNKRQGTSKVKTRGEVTGSRRKIWKQKGTGNARHGAKSAPIFVGGGVAHGPTGLENWTLKLSKHMKKKALIIALSLQSENIFVTDNLADFDGKTKTAAKLLKDLNIFGKRVLLATDGNNELIRRAFGNIQKVNVMEGSLVNALDVASSDAIIFSKDAVKSLEKRLMKKVKS
ncbi:MAG: 50S ribosomal protein L4 [Candidatus Pacebacteria bacterium CG_4_10_14_3_um_filter_34_15]|nr:50S ribosomal protein L4 [Candidatus Pacearchaeota archaeon]NCQ65247.1 50S ribosomal protein L4 [Candidatus Paceibacterota bacterium]OIO45026.1 MAG: 50S ribosomal protein L4 [Candidatus Pacebacteria bacterium CG1_02_43_31]PIQ81026.1 MAG: 50S ribosomal protein L4 [Candidatus Pacebacteria bacterium CG11_big_fil_rev_8_21_14_0_20_34_55]PIX81843.1 MAG: 50S ribosomal protein L4 [Candidatus Pacebacteria bacterium CG_4_10_14_3_um_filter_34_15]PJC44058.1 MAG: 50S ribosomal protein L4 [Candidatus Pac